MHRHRRSSARSSSAFALIAALSITGCSAPEETRDAIATGEDGQVGAVKLRSMLVVSAEEGSAGRLLGTLDNESSAAVEVVIGDPDDRVTVTVPADGQYPLDTNEEILSTVEDPPGALTQLTLATPSESTTLDVPVLDGTLDQYEAYLPD